METENINRKHHKALTSISDIQAKIQRALLRRILQQWEMIDVFFAQSQSSDFSILCSLYDKRESNFRHYQHMLMFVSNS